jgi:hypothetical protein
MYIKIFHRIFKAIEKFIQLIQKILSNMSQLDNITMANNFILNGRFVDNHDSKMVVF